MQPSQSRRRACVPRSGASIGLARYPVSASDAGELLRNDDAAMCHAKRVGLHRYTPRVLPIAFVWNMHCCRKGCPCESAGLSDGENPPRLEGSIGTTSKTLKMKGLALGRPAWQRAGVRNQYDAWLHQRRVMW